MPLGINDYLGNGVLQAAEDFFKSHSYDEIELEVGGHATVTVEDLYQHFKYRLMAELCEVGGTLYEREDLKG